MENARQLKEEQLAKEKKEREEKRRREVEEKRRAIKAEIQVLNKEIENLGLALFGKKAKRKAELKEQIARKQKELASIH